MRNSAAPRLLLQNAACNALVVAPWHSFPPHATLPHHTPTLYAIDSTMRAAGACGGITPAAGAPGMPCIASQALLNLMPP